MKSTHGGGFRTDIEGMRAIAIVAVLLCHAGIGLFAGGYVGVDVFFVISGFLITRLLLGEVGRSNSISLRRFYARRAKRLLPQSAILLAAVGILTILILSPLRAQEVSGDIIASALYVANWHFAAQSVDYFAQGLEPSPVLHLWSLAIEEQFYVVWPSIILAVTWFQRRRGRPVKPVLWVTIAVIFFGSLFLGIHLTDQTPASAYFSTFGRAWELALGGALALLGAVKIPRATAAAIGWAGVAAIVYASIAFDATTPFPGTAALVPTLGTAALILAGSSVYAKTKGSAAAPLSLRPVRYVGRISYAWYLWHWPALVFAAALWGTLSPLAGVAVVLASLLPTVLTHHFIEDPVRRSRSLARLPNRSLAIGAACMGIAVISGLLVANLQPTITTAPLSTVKGAAELVDQPLPQERAKAVRPNPLGAREDRSRAFSDGCLIGIAGTNSNKCLYGDPHGKRTLILFGDSHALQYFPPLEAIAEENDWRLIDLTKAECPPAEVEVKSLIEDREYSQCDAWRQKTLERIEEAGSRATVIMSSDSVYEAFPTGMTALANSEALQAGMKSTLERLHRAGLETVVIHDLPRSEFDVPSCVSENLDDLRSCAFEPPHDPDLEFNPHAASELPYVHQIDLQPQVCPNDLCRAVIGNALTYRDKDHLTATFARTLAPWLMAGLEQAGLHKS